MQIMHVMSSWQRSSHNGEVNDSSEISERRKYKVSHS